MLLAPLPFDYVKQMDPGDRVRRTRARPTGTRLRRLPEGTENKK
jgi:hypothetical protein